MTKDKLTKAIESIKDLTPQELEKVVLSHPSILQVTFLTIEDEKNISHLFHGDHHEYDPNDPRYNG